MIKMFSSSLKFFLVSSKLNKSNLLGGEGPFYLNEYKELGKYQQFSKDYNNCYKILLKNYKSILIIKMLIIVLTPLYILKTVFNSDLSILGCHQILSDKSISSIELNFFCFKASVVIEIYDYNTNIFK